MTRENGPLSGQRFGNYLLLELLNIGGMAEVYHGREASGDHEVAVKVLPPALAADPEYVARFKNEAALVRKLAHPNIVPIEYFGEHGKYLYLVMPLLKGSLRDVLNRGVRVPPIDAVAVATQVASALTAVHALGIIHRDVKPDNILLSDDRALLTDFGITRRIEIERPGQASTLAGTGLPVGTPQYMAPEQLAGQYVDHRADLYALGVVLYEMLTGQPPHLADTPYAVASRVLSEPIPPPSTLNPAVWPELDAVVMRALSRDPKDRYANAGSMRDALRQVDDMYRRNAAVAPNRPTKTGAPAAPPPSPFPPAASDISGWSSFGRLASAPMPSISPPNSPPPVARNAGGETGGGGDRRGGHGNGNDGSGNDGNGGGPTPGGADGDDRRRRLPRPALLAGLAAMLLVVSVFCGLSLFINNGARNTANTTPTSTLSYDPTYEGKAATATVLEKTPTVTTGPGTPTPTPRPPLPTRTPTPRPTRTPYPPTVTTGPNTPTPTPRPPTTTPTPTLTPNPTPTFTPIPTPTFTPIPTPTPTNTPAPTPTDTPTPTPTATPTPTPPLLDVTPPLGTFTCGVGNLIPNSLQVTNIGGGTLTWSATTDDPTNVTLSLDHGSLGQGGSDVVNILGTPGGMSFNVIFTSVEDGSQTVPYTCT